ncbi:hypothetical protein QCA50_010432 [Cerrena zonata]|uniref:Uncharacterized protein n=1 Tax=Cerrena zonata TaxID=2478898 RepID=A0AAW0G1F2_9APHY
MVLSQCNRLQELQFALDCGLSPTIDTFFTQTDRFISLQVLDILLIKTDSLLFTIRMVQAIRSQDFQKFHLDISTPYAPAEIYKLLCAVGTHKRLRSLRLSSITSINKGIVLPNETIEPSFQLFDLVKFEMRGLPLRLGLTKELLGRMAQSWSDISSLEYHSGLSLQETTSLPTFDITYLETLANLCPKLKKLSIPFSSTLNGDITQDLHFQDLYLPAQRASAIPLTLDVSQCTIVSKMAAALYLTRLYPQLRIFPYPEEWKEKIRLRGGMGILEV